MNNDEQKLDSLTNQTVTISLGGRSYTARRATLYDVGLMNKKKKELLDKGDSANVDLDVTFYILYELIKDYNPGISNPEGLMKSIPFESYKDVIDSLSAVGFKVPQSQIDQATKMVTGA